MDAGVRIGNIAGAPGDIAIGHTAHSTGLKIVNAVPGHLHGAGAGHGVLHVQGVGAHLIKAVAGVRGQYTPAGGDNQGIGVDALPCAKDVGGADHALKPQGKGRPLHHGHHQGVILFLGVLGLLGVDHGAVDAQDAVVPNRGCGADDALGEDHGVGHGHVSTALGEHHGAFSLEVIGTVALAADGHILHGEGCGVGDDPVKEGTVGIQFPAGDPRRVIVCLSQKCRDRLRLHDAVGVHLQGGAVGVLGGLTRHVHELGKFAPGCGAGSGLKGPALFGQLFLVGKIVEDVVLVSVDHQGQHAAVFRRDDGPVGQGHRGDVGGRGGAVDPVVLRGVGGYHGFPEFHPGDGGTVWLRGWLRSRLGLGRRLRRRILLCGSLRLGRFCGFRLVRYLRYRRGSRLGRRIR